MNYFVKTGLVATTLAVAAISAPAMADMSAGEARVAKVSYSDLDLSTPAGMVTLKSRLVNAARDVCGMDIKVSGTLLPSREARACYVKTRANFTPRMATLAERDGSKG